MVWGHLAHWRNRLRRRGLLPAWADRVAYALLLRLLPPPDREVEVPLPVAVGGTLLLPPRSPSARTLMAGRYEPDLTRLVLTLVGDGWVCVDGGAYAGYYTVLMGVLGARVLAFEPDPTAYHYLQQNIARHRLDGQVTAYQAALSDRPGTVVLGRGRPEKRQVGTAGRGVEVQAVALDDLLADEAQVSLVKLDLEGWEAPALRGALRTLSRLRPLLVVEWDPPALRRTGQGPDLHRLLWHDLPGLGYGTPWSLEDGRAVPQPPAHHCNLFLTPL